MMSDADLKLIIYDMVFAYANKDDDMPHGFEIEAVMNACAVLDDPLQNKFAQKVLESIREAP